MKIVKKIAAQGDVTFVRVDKLPDGLKESANSEGPSGFLNRQDVIITHSETGHHHVARGERIRLYGTDDPMVCYLVNETGTYADIVHERSFDTHETLRLDGPVWKIVRQREATPEGWKRVED